MLYRSEDTLDDSMWPEHVEHRLYVSKSVLEVISVDVLSRIGRRDTAKAMQRCCLCANGKWPEFEV